MTPDLAIPLPEQRALLVTAQRVPVGITRSRVVHPRAIGIDLPCLRPDRLLKFRGVQLRVVCGRLRAAALGTGQRRAGFGHGRRRPGCAALRSRGRGARQTRRRWGRGDRRRSLRRRWRSVTLRLGRRGRHAREQGQAGERRGSCLHSSLSTVSISQVGLGAIDGLQGTFEGNRVSTGTLGNRPKGMSCLWRLPLPAHRLGGAGGPHDSTHAHQTCLLS